jgi:DNA-binding response OmpR family regulator
MTEADKRILLVEDDRYLRRACEATLQRRGFTVRVASDGEEGLRLARSENPDLILLDLLMPKMSGLEMLRALRSDEDTCRIPVLVLSNSSSPRDAGEVSALGIEGYWVKANLSLKELGDRVTSLLGA